MSTVKKSKIFAIVHFEDQGQDFLFFKIAFYPDFNYGHIYDCQPFQSSVWNNQIVLSGKPKVGAYLTISKSPSHPVRRIKYKINKVEFEK